jgi:hypothetical protein
MSAATSSTVTPCPHLGPAQPFISSVPSANIERSPYAARVVSFYQRLLRGICSCAKFPLCLYCAGLFKDAAKIENGGYILRTSGTYARMPLAASHSWLFASLCPSLASSGPCVQVQILINHKFPFFDQSLPSLLTSSIRRTDASSPLEASSKFVQVFSSTAGPLFRNEPLTIRLACENLCQTFHC